MDDYIFLTTEEALEIHKHQIKMYGGMDGLRDAGLLDSALHQASAMAFGEYLHQDLAEMAAAYLFSVVKNHPFFDGNKRAGAAIAYVFLNLNGYRIVTAEEEFEKLVLSVADGTCQKAAVAEFVRNHMMLIDSDES